MSVWVLEKVPVLNGSSVLLPRVCEGSLIKGSLKEIVFGFEGSLSEGSTQGSFKWMKQDWSGERKPATQTLEQKLGVMYPPFVFFGSGDYSLKGYSGIN